MIHLHHPVSVDDELNYVIEQKHLDKNRVPR